MVTYTVSATVPAGVRVYDLTLTDTLAANLAYGSTTSITCSDNDGPPCADALPVLAPTAGSASPLRWYVGDVTPSAQTRTLTLTYTARVRAASAGGATLTNGVSAGWNATNRFNDADLSGVTWAFDYGTTNATTSITVVRPTIVVQKSVDLSGTSVDYRHAAPGDLLTYTITVRNTGTATAHEVLVEDTRTATLMWEACPALNLGGATLGSESTAAGLTTRTFTIASLASAAETSLVYCLRVPSTVTSADDQPLADDLVNTVDATYATQVTGTPERAGYDDVPTDFVGIELDLPGGLLGTVWLDRDRERDIDAGEYRTGGVLLRISGDNGFTRDVTTGADGRWSIDGYVPAGNYTVTILSGQPAGTEVNSFLGVANDGTSMTFSFTEGERKDGIDLGLVGLYSLGDTVWQDLDGDGLFTAGEGLGGVTVRARWAGADGVLGNGDDRTFPVVTATDGSYRIDDLPGGPYTVSIQVPTPLQGSLTPFTDQDGGDFASTALTLAGNRIDIDFGLRPFGQAVSGTVWVDQDRDSVLDGGEPGLPGVRVKVCFQGSTTNCQEVITGPDRGWRIDNPPAGAVTVTIPPLGGGDPQIPGSLPPGDASGVIPTGGAVGGLNIPIVFDPSAALGDTVWRDDNRNFVLDPGEVVAPGVLIEATWAGLDGVLNGTNGATSTDDVTFTAITDSDGQYNLAGMPPGDYRVRISQVPSGWVPLRDSDDGDPFVTLVTLPAGTVLRTVDFALIVAPPPPLDPVLPGDPPTAPGSGPGAGPVPGAPPTTPGKPTGKPTSKPTGKPTSKPTSGPSGGRPDDPATPSSRPTTRPDGGQRPEGGITPWPGALPYTGLGVGAVLLTAVMLLLSGRALRGGRSRGRR